jgi:hypothetical protein
MLPFKSKPMVRSPIVLHLSTCHRPTSPEAHPPGPGIFTGGLPIFLRRLPGKELFLALTRKAMRWK